MVLFVFHIMEEPVYVRLAYVLLDKPLALLICKSRVFHFRLKVQ